MHFQLCHIQQSTASQVQCHHRPVGFSERVQDINGQNKADLDCFLNRGKSYRSVLFTINSHSRAKTGHTKIT